MLSVKENSLSNDLLAVMVLNPQYEEATKQVFERAAFVADVASAGGDCSRHGETELDVLPRHYQQTGFVHAGVQATMADQTAG